VVVGHFCDDITGVRLEGLDYDRDRPPGADAFEDGLVAPPFEFTGDASCSRSTTSLPQSAGEQLSVAQFYFEPWQIRRQRVLLDGAVLIEYFPAELQIPLNVAESEREPLAEFLDVPLVDGEFLLAGVDPDEAIGEPLESFFSVFPLLVRYVNIRGSPKVLDRGVGPAVPRPCWIVDVVALLAVADELEGAVCPPATRGGTGNELVANSSRRSTVSSSAPRVCCQNSLSYPATWSWACRMP